MLATFRRVRSSWIVVALLGLIAFAFIITGVGTPRGFGGLHPGAQWVASAGGEEITAPELNDVLQRQLTQIREQQPDSNVDAATLVKSGAFDEILSQLIDRKAMIAFGKDQGMTVSKEMIDTEIASAPAFQDVTGKFDDTKLRMWLANNKVSEQQLRQDIAADLMQRQLLPPVGAGAKVPATIARQYTALLLESRSGSVGIVPSAAMAGGKDATLAEIQAYYNSHLPRYTIPERRVIRYAVFGRPDVAAAAKPTEAEIAQYYQANLATYGPSEKRTLSQVVLPDRGAAQAFAAKISGGESFAAAAAEAGYQASDTAIGTLTREDVAKRFSPAVANAAFSAPQGGTTQPVQSPLGWHVLRVDAIDRSAGRPLSAVSGEIAQKLEETKAADLLNDMVSKMEDEVAGGASFDEVVRGHNLSVQQTPPVTASGAAPDVPSFQLPAEVGPLLKTASQMSAEDDPAVETITKDQRFALLSVTQVVPAAPPPLAKIADRVKADLLAQRASDRAKAVASAILAKVNSGVAIRDAFGQAGMPLPPVQSVSAKRVDISRQDAKVPAALAALFRLKAGKAVMLPAPNGAGWFVSRLDQVTPGDPASSPGMIAVIQNQLAQSLGSEYAQEFSQSLSRQVKVERNEGEISTLRSQLLKGAGE